MDATRRLAEIMALPEPRIPLDEAALLVAAHAHPGLDVDAELARIDEHAAGVRDPTLTGVVRHLFRDLGFIGNTDDYYDPRNSFLDDVISRRTGIPITLSLLTMEVGRRIGVPLWGVGMPGHFLLRDKVDPTVFIDPFSGGRLLDVRGCAQLFRRIQGPASRLDPAFLDPVPRDHIVGRLLGNLRIIYAQRGDRPALAWVLRLRTLLPGAAADDHREHARALAGAGEFAASADAQLRAADAVRAAGGDPAADLALADQLRARLN
jgi:regulator of sirC expression with transglutaminase-like and TPR domain